MKYIIILMALLLMVGCGRESSQNNSGKTYDDLDEEVANESNETNTIEGKEKKVAELSARLAAAHKDLEEFKKAEAAAKLRAIQTMAYWSAGVCGAIGLLSVAAFIILMVQGIHIGKKLIIGIGVAAFVVGGISLFAGKYIEYYQWIGGILLIASVIYGAWYLYRMTSINKEHCKVGVDALWELMQIRDSDNSGMDDIKKQAALAVDGIKKEARKRQAKKGIYNDVNKLIQPYKKSHHIPVKLGL